MTSLLVPRLRPENPKDEIDTRHRGRQGEEAVADGRAIRKVCRFQKLQQGEELRYQSQLPSQDDI